MRSDIMQMQVTGINIGLNNCYCYNFRIYLYANYHELLNRFDQFEKALNLVFLGVDFLFMVSSARFKVFLLLYNMCLFLLYLTFFSFI